MDIVVTLTLAVQQPAELAVRYLMPVVYATNQTHQNIDGTISKFGKNTTLLNDSVKLCKCVEFLDHKNDSKKTFTKSGLVQLHISE